jgi:ferredoxin
VTVRLERAALDHPRWDDVAERCLTCGNCTMVCPTCFCTTVEDVTDLAGATIEGERFDTGAPVSARVAAAVAEVVVLARSIE